MRKIIKEKKEKVGAEENDCANAKFYIKEFKDPQKDWIITLDALFDKDDAWFDKRSAK